MLALALSLSLLLAPAATPSPSTTVMPKAIFLVRHAEKAKADKDPPLSKEGTARAARLADHLRDAGITTILTTEYQRTKRTAAPLAARLEIEPTVLAGDAKAIAAKALEGSGNALIVGHSNTIPEILAALGVQTPVEIGDDEYSNLFVVVPAAQEGGPATFLRLRY